VDQNGNLVFAPGLNLSEAPRKLSAQQEVKSVLAGESGTRFVWQEGKQVLVTRYPLCSCGWGLLVQIPEAEIDKALWNAERPVALLGLLFVTLAAMIGSVLAWLHRRLRRAQHEIASLNTELRAQVAQLEARNKELEAFSYSVSHDVRAPLRHIAGFSRMLQQECGEQLTLEGRACLDQIQNSCRRMQRLVEDLLRFSRMGEQAVHRQMTRLDEVAAEVISGLQRDLDGRDVRFEVFHLPQIECDRGLVTQVFWNLLSNAVKYTAGRKHAVIAIGECRQKDENVFFVRDNGVGFDMKHADKLFHAFQRLHGEEEFEGSGVGLATAKRIIS
jgi:signal transduction histidine kinase